MSMHFLLAVLYRIFYIVIRTVCSPNVNLFWTSKKIKRSSLFCQVIAAIWHLSFSYTNILHIYTSHLSPGEVQSEDSDHDYESADLIDTIKKMQEFVSYWAAGSMRVDLHQAVRISCIIPLRSSAGNYLFSFLSNADCYECTWTSHI